MGTETQSHRGGPRRSSAASCYRVETREEAGKAYRDLPALLREYAFTSSSATKAHCLPGQQRKSARGTEARASPGFDQLTNLWGAAGSESLLFSFPTDQKFSPTGPFNFPIILPPSWIFHVPRPHVHTSLSGGLAYSNTHHNFPSLFFYPTPSHSDPPSG